MNNASGIRSVPIRNHIMGDTVLLYLSIVTFSVLKSLPRLMKPDSEHTSKMQRHGDCTAILPPEHIFVMSWAVCNILISHLSTGFEDLHKTRRWYCHALSNIWKKLSWWRHDLDTHSILLSKALCRDWKAPGPRFNIKMSSYQYRKSHCGDKTVVRSSYLHNGISYTGKMSSLYWIRALLPMDSQHINDEFWPFRCS